MGLDTTHDAFHGAYSAFNSFRQVVARAMGGSFPPHWKFDTAGNLVKDGGDLPIFDREMDGERWYWGDDYGPETHPGLFEFMAHSDCEGEISPEMCVKVADDLEALLPAIERVAWPTGGHIGRDGGFVAVTKRFITGCRAAAEAGEPLEFQ